jgi:transcriptional regulator with XRE-family HTH domain
MHARDLGEALTLIMEERGWTQTRLGRELGKDQPWVSRVARGVYDPGTRAARALLAKVGWELRIAPKTEEDDPVKRREFVAGTASVLFVPSPKTTPFHDPSYVGLLTRRTARINNEIGGDSLSATLLAQARKIQAASTAGGRELYLAASEFLRRGAYVLRQAGNTDAALKFAENALVHARRAGNSDEQAAAYFALGFICGFKGNHGITNAFKGSAGQAVMFAQRGLRLPDITDESRAFLNACLARGFANTPGHERQARTAIEQVLSIDSLAAVERADVMGIAGNALRDARAYREALELLDDAARLSAPVSPFYQAVYLADQVQIALSTREPSRAASVMQTLAYVVPLVDSTEVTRQVQHILNLSKPWATAPEIRTAREQLQAVNA